MEYKMKKEKYEELLVLQEKYEKGEIDENSLTLKELELLNKLYDIQIRELAASNNKRKEKLLAFRKKYLK